MSGSDERLSDVVLARYWHLEGGKVVCDLCPRRCALNEGQRGVCFVRQRRDDELVLTTWGRSSGFCIDPIEKKPLSHFLPGTAVLSFGTAGCNLTCRFCQNSSISKSRQADTLAERAHPEQLADAALSAGCRSVAYTYNDPIIFLEYAVDVAKACRERGIRNVAVTAGYVCDEPRRELFEHMDAANVDLKAFTERFYSKLCGGHLEDVLDTLRYIKHHTKVWLELTTLIIPGENDSDDELDQLSRWVLAELGADVPVHFSAFHPAWKLLEPPRTPPETLSRARRLAMNAGLHFVYTGNVHDKEGDTTACPGCGEPVIERDWYRLLSYGLDDHGRCAGCGTQLPGVFDGPPGQWGSRRQPVRIGR